LVPGTVALLAGQAGTGKSFIAEALADAVASGGRFAGMPTNQSPVLYFHEEMTMPEVAERIRLMMTPEEALNHKVWYAIRSGARIDTPGGRDQLITTIMDMRVRLVVMDSLSDFHRQPENSNEMMGNMLRAVRDMAGITGACILIIHHSGKPKSEEDGSEILRGASALRDVASDIMVVSETDKEGRRLIFKKVRHGARPRAIPVEIQMDVDGYLGVRFQEE
jgi:RecA-family ATPase